jgi:predicted ester cyclase
LSNVGVRSGDVHPLLQLMRAYAFAYTANHDFDVCPAIMIDEYELRMGAHRIVGRDRAYRDATQRQFDQYPGLGFTVHDVVTNGERVALRFSEHGYSTFQNANSVWGGVSLYRWDGSRLTSCLVEQDYFARRRQLTSHEANPVESPAIDPWTVTIEAPSTADEEAVQTWVRDGGIDASDPGTLDDEWCAPRERYVFDVHESVIDDIFSAGSRVAFHVTQSGTLVSGPGVPATSREDYTRHAAGIADVSTGSVTARIITDRIELSKGLQMSQRDEST